MLRRRLRLAGIVVAATAMATAAAFVQACKGAASRGSSAPNEETEPNDRARPVTIVVEPAPATSDEPDGNASPEAPPTPEEPVDEPRRGRPADSTIIYE